MDIEKLLAARTIEDELEEQLLCSYSSFQKKYDRKIKDIIKTLDIYKKNNYTEDDIDEKQEKDLFQCFKIQSNIIKDIFSILFEICKLVMIQRFRNLGPKDFEVEPTHLADDTTIFRVLQLLGEPTSTTLILYSEQGRLLLEAYRQGEKDFCNYIKTNNLHLIGLSKFCYSFDFWISYFDSCITHVFDKRAFAPKTILRNIVLDSSIQIKYRDFYEKNKKTLDEVKEKIDDETSINNLLKIFENFYLTILEYNFNNKNSVLFLNEITEEQKDIVISCFDDYLFPSLGIEKSINEYIAEWNQESESEENNSEELQLTHTQLPLAEELMEDPNEDMVEDNKEESCAVASDSSLDKSTLDSRNGIEKLKKEDWFYLPEHLRNGQASNPIKSPEPNEYLGLIKGINPDEIFYAFINHLAKLDIVDKDKKILHAIAFRLSGYDRNPEILDIKPIFRGKISKNNLALIILSIVEKKPKEKLKQNQSEYVSAYKRAKEFFSYEQEERSDTLEGSYAKNADSTLRALIQLYFNGVKASSKNKKE